MISMWLWWAVCLDYSQLVDSNVPEGEFGQHVVVVSHIPDKDCSNGEGKRIYAI